MMRRKYGFTALLIMFLLAVFPFRTALSPSLTNLFIDPERTTALLGENFTIDIAISDVEDLRGWEAKLYYRSTLNATDVNEGPFLKSGGASTFFYIEELDEPFNSTHNRIWLASILIGNASGVSGTGTLATVNFTVTQEGNSTLHLSDTELRSSCPTCTLPHVTTDGFFEIILTHNLALTNVNARKISLTLVDINATVKNKGIVTESNINLSIYYNDNLIETGTISILEPAQDTTLNFKWNITTVAEGNYTIKAHVMPALGESFTTDNVYIDGVIQVIHYPPIAYFEYSPTSPIADEGVTFNATHSTPNGGAIISYLWDFGDGNNGTGSITTHTYASYGNYNVTLTVTDSEGVTDSQSNQVNVRQHPTANFTHSPEFPISGETVNFNASTSKPNGGIIETYDWLFGDGEIGSGMIASHEYSTTGTFNVTLTVLDSEELTDSTWRLVRIEVFHDIAVTGATVFPNTTYVGRTVNITVTVNNLGETTEIFDLKVYYDENLIETKNVTLATGENVTLVYIWTTEGTVPCHNYIIRAEASANPYEKDIANNMFIAGEVKIITLADLDGDGKIDMKDIAIAARAFGTHPGDSRWNPTADLDGNSNVDMRDIARVAKAFGSVGTCE